AADGKQKLRHGHPGRDHAGAPIGGSSPSDHLLPLRHGDARRGGRQVGVRPGRGGRAGPAPIGLLLRDRAMSTAIEDRRRAARPGVETVFAELLAEVLHVDRVSVDSHFFDELGADSLVMAHFCARVRKRGDLPSVSIRDVYAHPTIRSLAAALEDVAPASAKRADAGALRLPTPTSTREYVLCGALQVLFYLGYSYLGVLAGIEGYQWLVAGSEGVGT